MARIHIDNNGAENAVRPFALGRKNWLFAYTPAGAEASATIYSIIQTAILNGLEPFWYMNYILEKLPFAKSREDFLALLPYNVDKKLVAPPGR